MIEEMQQEAERLWPELTWHIDNNVYGGPRLIGSADWGVVWIMAERYDLSVTVRMRRGERADNALRTFCRDTEVAISLAKRAVQRYIQKKQGFATPNQPEPDLHLYLIEIPGDCGDAFVAYSQDDAVELWREIVGGYPDIDIDDYTIRVIGDDEVYETIHVDEPGQPKESKTGAEWCAEWGHGYMFGWA